MDLKLTEVDGKQYAEVQDGKPVFVVDGKDVAYDVPQMASKITALNGESQGHREAKEQAEKDLKAFAGISDPAAAIKALETVANLDDNKLVEAGKVEEIKAAAARAAEEQKAAAIKAKDEEYAPIVKQRDELQSALNTEIIGGNFNRSKFIEENVGVPVPMLQNTFGQHFSIEDGKLVARDAHGTEIYSKSRPGEIADFEEAIEQLIDKSPYRDDILIGTNQNGSGAPGGTPGGRKSMPRSEFNKLSPKARAAKFETDPDFQVLGD